MRALDLSCVDISALSAEHLAVCCGLPLSYHIPGGTSRPPWAAAVIVLGDAELLRRDGIAVDWQRDT